VLTLKGEKRQEEESGDKTFHRTERRYGSFRRVLQLPGDADENAISATMKNGILQVEIGKNEKAAPSSRKIEIKAS
ncbi:MAG TPA: Hsp20/alpha crystallin family protein, partial [Micavibrio sp.]